MVFRRVSSLLSLFKAYIYVLAEEKGAFSVRIALFASDMNSFFTLSHKCNHLFRCADVEQKILKWSGQCTNAKCYARTKSRPEISLSGLKIQSSPWSVFLECIYLNKTISLSVGHRILLVYYESLCPLCYLDFMITFAFYATIVCYATICNSFFLLCYLSVMILHSRHP